MVVNKLSHLILVIFLAVILYLPTTAQEASNDLHPLLDLLNRMPQPINEPDQTYQITYSDFEVMRQSHTNLTLPSVTTLTEFTTLDADIQNALLETLPLSPMEILYLAPFSINTLEEMYDLTGVDFFTIHQGLTFWARASGDSCCYPTHIYHGDFDPNLITSVHLNKGYTVEDRANVQVLCYIDCTQMPPEDLQNRNVVDIFQYGKGIKSPIGLETQYIYNTRTPNEMNSMIASAQDIENSLLDDPSYHSLASAMTRIGNLRQAIIFQAKYFSIEFMHSRIPPEVAQRLESEIPAFLDLPPYSLIGFYDFIDSEQQILTTAIGLVYEEESKAEAAVSELNYRIANWESNELYEFFYEQSFADEFQQHIGEINMEIVSDEQTGFYVVIVKGQKALSTDNTGIQFLLGLATRKVFTWIHFVSGE